MDHPTQAWYNVPACSGAPVLPVPHVFSVWLSSWPPGSGVFPSGGAGPFVAAHAGNGAGTPLALHVGSLVFGLSRSILEALTKTFGAMN